MTTKQISNDEYSPLKIANLPTRPTAPQEFGGKGYSPSELKRAFDALPMLAINRINQLISDICAEGENSVATEIKSGIERGHSLSQFFIDLKSGEAASYIQVFDSTLADCLSDIQAQIGEIKEILERNKIR